MGGYIWGAVILIAVLLVLYIVHIYNKLVKRRNRVKSQWAQIEVQLMRRVDLIPNLVETVKGYAFHEKEILETVAAARNALAGAVSPAEAMEANIGLSDSLLRLLAISEAYPELKADKAFVRLQSALVETENKIAYARQFYNDTVLLYRDTAHQFPSNIIATMFRFKDAEFYIVPKEKSRI